MGQRSRRCNACGYTAGEEYYPEGTMYRGGVNDPDAVTELQVIMTEMGYSLGEIDGVYGRQTKQAVMDFQMKAGIPVPADGIGWPKTIAMIKAERTGQTAATPTAAPQATEAPTAEPTAAPTPAPTVYEVESPCCMVADSGQIEYCSEHQALIEVDALLNGSARDESSRIKALKQSRTLWEAELELLNRKWLDAAAQDEKDMVQAGIDAFAAYLSTQEALWKQQYKNNEAAALEKANQMLMEQCASVCPIIYGLTAELVYTEKGYVSIRLTDGWYVGASMAKDSITLHHAALGTEEESWMTITDAQNIDGLEPAKQIARFTYPDGEFAEVTIGRNTFWYIVNEQGTGFAMLAETSTGKTMKIDGRNCTLEQAMPLLQTLTIY